LQAQKQVVYFERDKRYAKGEHWLCHYEPQKAEKDQHHQIQKHWQKKHLQVQGGLVKLLNKLCF
jgi:hypothetical protein